MSVFGTKNIMNVFVGKDIAGNATAGMVDLLNDMADGQVVAVGTPSSGGGEVIMPTTATPATYPYFRLVEKQGGVLNYGPRIKTSDVIFAKQKTYSAPSEQVYFIGYNGTSGSLDVSQANEFILTIAYDHDDMMWSEQKLRNSYDYYSTAPTQQGLATSMASQIAYKEQLGVINGTGRMVIAEVLNNAAAGTVTTFGAGLTAAVVQGSDIITVSGAFSASITVGTALRLGSDAVTSPIYFVNAVNNTGSAANGLPARGIKLNMAYQGVSNTALDVTGTAGNSGFIAAGSLGTSWGIRITSQALTWVKDFFKFMKVKFHFDLKGFGATPYDKPGALTSANSSESSKGVGTAFEVAEMESFAAGFEGALNRMVVPLPAGRTYADTTTPKTYDVIVIESVDSSPALNNGIIGNAGMRVQQFVCMPVSAANKTKLKAQLDAVLGITL